MSQINRIDGLIFFLQLQIFVLLPSVENIGYMFVYIFLKIPGTAFLEIKIFAK